MDTGHCGAEPVNLLLVDDVPANLLALSAVLNQPDYRIVTAGSGREALRALLQDEFAVALLDVAMPEMDGFELAQTLRASERTRYIPIIFVSAIARDLKDIFRGYAAGGVDYIVKPLEPEVVRAKVAVFAELFRRQREIQRKDELIRNSERAGFLEREQAARLRAEAAEKRFRNLVNALDHAIILEGDPGLGKLSFVSDRIMELLGLSREKCLSEPGFFLEHVHPEDRKLVLEGLERLRTQRTEDTMGVRFEHRIRGADGEYRWFHTGFDGELGANGVLVRVRGLCVDISPLKKVEHELREAVRAREDIVAVVAHDLKTPLTAAALTTSLLKKSVEKSDFRKLDERAGQLKLTLDRAISLTEEILDVERMGAGKFAVELEEEDPVLLLDEVVSLLRPLADEKGIQLHFGSPASLGRIPCDRARIRQVLGNIIGNAIKFTPRCGEIWVGAERNSEAVVFSIRDTGPGIDPDDVPHIFERYWQPQVARRNGTGLGLTIAKGIVEAHHGRIWVESAVGKGSTFRFALPLVGHAEARGEKLLSSSS